MGGLYPVDDEDERDRYFNEGSVTRNLIDKIRYDVFDFESFKELLKQAFSEDTSLRELLTRNGWGEDSYRALYNHPLIQAWVEKNDHDKTIRFLSRQANVSIPQARSMFQRMSADDKRRIRIASAQQRKVTIRKRQKKRAKRIPKITQISRTGTSYRRQKPQKWTELQIRFLNNNRQQRVERILELYNLIFPANPRTISSLRNKLYRTRT